MKIFFKVTLKKKKPLEKDVLIQHQWIFFPPPPSAAHTANCLHSCGCSEIFPCCIKWSSDIQDLRLICQTGTFENENPSRCVLLNIVLFFGTQLVVRMLEVFNWKGWKERRKKGPVLCQRTRKETTGKFSTCLDRVRTSHMPNKEST